MFVSGYSFVTLIESPDRPLVPALRLKFLTGLNERAAVRESTDEPPYVFFANVNGHANLWNRFIHTLPDMSPEVRAAVKKNYVAISKGFMERGSPDDPTGFFNLRSRRFMSRLDFAAFREAGGRRSPDREGQPLDMEDLVASWGG